MLRLTGQTQAGTAAHINLPSSSLDFSSQLPTQVIYIYNQTPIAAALSPLPVITAATNNLESTTPVSTLGRVKHKKTTTILPHADADADTRTTIAMPHSHSSSDSSVERVYYDPRREARKRDKGTSSGRREVIVHNHKAPSGDEPLRRSDMMANRWK
ncbi:hypothetical protein DV735_g2958, partial [Chaetothyriales sp. CBS 134920]